MVLVVLVVLVDLVGVAILHLWPSAPYIASSHPYGGGEGPGSVSTSDNANEI